MDRNFKVTKAILTEKSQFFKALFAPRFADFKEATKPKLLEVPRDGVEVVLQGLHNPDFEGKLEMKIPQLWQIVSVCDKYQIDHKVLAPWFARWYKKNVPDLDNRCLHLDGCDYHCDVGSLLFPCYAFDHSYAFKEVTKHLVYNSPRHIYERNPTLERHLSTPVRIVRKYPRQSFLSSSLIKQQNSSMAREGVLDL